MHWLIFFLLPLIWGSSFMLMKRAAAVTDSLSMASWRVVGGAITLGLIWPLLRKPWPLVRRDLLPAVFLAVVGYAMPFWIYSALTPKLGSAYMGTTVTIVPLLTIVFSIPLLKIYPTARQLVGVVGGLIFMAILLQDKFRTAESATLTQVLLSLAAPGGYALGNTFVRARFAAVHPLAVTLAALLLAIPMLLPASILLEDHRWPPAASDGWIAILCLTLLAVFATGLGGYWLYILIQRRGPLLAGMVTYLIPLVALGWGVFDKEKLTATHLLALLGVLSMVGLVQFSRPPAHASSKTPDPEIPPTQ